MIDPSSTEDDSDEESVPRRKTGKRQILTTQESNAKELSLPPSDIPSVIHPPSRIHETESKPVRSR